LSKILVISEGFRVIDLPTLLNYPYKVSTSNLTRGDQTSERRNKPFQSELVRICYEDQWEK